MGTYEKMIEVVKNWDPFQMGSEFYETEASDVVNVASVFDDSKYIAKKIQHIYFMSFEEVPALEKCEKLAVELLIIKEGGSYCRLSEFPTAFYITAQKSDNFFINMFRFFFR